MDQEDVIRKVIGYTRRIAVVGLSSSPFRPSHGVARTLLRYGFDVIPVNPTETEVLGIPAVASLKELEGPIDMVDVFRRPEFLVETTEAAVECGARAVWLQQGLVSPEAREIAEAAGLDFVEDRCTAVEVKRLLPSR